MPQIKLVPWARIERGNAHPNKIRPTARRHRDLPVRETIVRRDGRHSSRPNRKMQIRGQGRMKLMAIIGESTGGGKVDLSHGRIEQIPDHAPKLAGLTKTQYAEWGQQKASTQWNTNDGDAYPIDSKQERGK